MFLLLSETGEGGIQMVLRRKKNQMIWYKYKVTEAARVSSKLL